MISFTLPDIPEAPAQIPAPLWAFPDSPANHSPCLLFTTLPIVCATLLAILLPLTILLSTHQLSERPAVPVLRLPAQPSGEGQRSARKPFHSVESAIVGGTGARVL